MRTTESASRTAEAEAILSEFATRTGIDADGGGDAGRRYLWTDAIAVEAFLDLASRTARAEHRWRARRLIGLVHEHLGRHRPDDLRIGWISGLPEIEGERRPTAGGLRIGKPLPERAPGEPFEDAAEWQRDGQYFHYLVRWMHALATAARTLGDTTLLRWALELAEVAARGFLLPVPGGGAPRLAWKMSIDLSRPLVSSSGAHDPLDGWIAALALRSAARRLEVDAGSLRRVTSLMRRTCEPIVTFASRDPLGAGGLLGAVAVLVALEGSSAPGDRSLVDECGVGSDPLVDRLLSDAARSLVAFASSGELERPIAARLGFRELGLALGMRTLERALRATQAARPAEASALDRRRRAARLVADPGLARRIEDAWRSPSARSVPAFRDHRDIGEVMLAASLLLGAAA